MCRENAEITASEYFEGRGNIWVKRVLIPGKGACPEL